MSPTPAPRTVVTGGSRGIGASVARLLSRRGHHVIAIARHAPGEDVPGARCLEADVTDASSLVAAFTRADEDGAGLTGLVVSAGAWTPTPLTGDVGRVVAEHRAILEVNLLGAVASVSAFVSRLRPGADASIALVGSTAGQRGESGYGAYAASKAALAGLCKTWAVELAPRRVRVNVVAPGWVDTVMSASALADPARRAEILATVPRGVIATPDDIAGPVAFLLGEDSLHLTGSVLSVNGGGVLASA